MTRMTWPTRDDWCELVGQDDWDDCDGWDYWDHKDDGDRVDKVGHNILMQIQGVFVSVKQFVKHTASLKS